MNPRNAIVGLVLPTSLVAVAPAAAEMAAASSPPGRVADPRLQRTGETEQVIREAGDAVFSRPFHFFRLVTGVAVVPVALPIAAVFADLRDGVDICVNQPYAMLFERPLGR